MKERVWLIFKKFDKKEVGFLNKEQMLEAIKEYFPKVIF